MQPLLQVLALPSKNCVSHNDYATNQTIKVLGDACSGFFKRRSLEMWGSAANMHAIYLVPCGLVQIKFSADQARFPRSEFLNSQNQSIYCYAPSEALEIGRRYLTTLLPSQLASVKRDTVSNP